LIAVPFVGSKLDRYASRKQRVERREERAVNREQSREQRAESREQTAESGEQRTDEGAVEVARTFSIGGKIFFFVFSSPIKKVLSLPK
jgi:Na+-translocating ferredoxin:NAD+ oxidoreductase RnfC subunit